VHRRTFNAVTVNAGQGSIEAGLMLNIEYGLSVFENALRLLFVRMPDLWNEAETLISLLELKQ